MCDGTNCKYKNDLIVTLRSKIVIGETWLSMNEMTSAFHAETSSDDVWDGNGQGKNSSFHLVHSIMDTIWQGSQRKRTFSQKR